MKIFKDIFVTKCRICGKKYWVSTPINAKVCQKCCNEISKEMEEKNIEQSPRELKRELCDAKASFDKSTEFILVGIIAMLTKGHIFLFILLSLANIALKVFLLWLEQRKYGDQFPL